MPRKPGTPLTDDTPVSQLWNLSALTAGWLVARGVRTYGELRRRDLVDLWLELRVAHAQVTRLMYYALWGAREDCHWNQIPEPEKQRFVEALSARGIELAPASPASRARPRRPAAPGRRR
jgi:DNA transformation protein